MLYLKVSVRLGTGKPQPFGPYEFLSADERGDWIEKFEADLAGLNEEFRTTVDPGPVKAVYNPDPRDIDEAMDAPQPEAVIRNLRFIWNADVGGARIV